MIFNYKGKRYPKFIRNGNGCQYITPIAQQFCKGNGLDVGAGKWPFPGAVPIDLETGGDAMNLPKGPVDHTGDNTNARWDYIFSSHCLEHLANPVAAIEHWRSRLGKNGVLFLYLPHPEMEYWLPQNNRKHLHAWRPNQILKMLIDLKFYNVLVSERDLAFSFAAVGFVDNNEVGT